MEARICTRGVFKGQYINNEPRKDMNLQELLEWAKPLFYIEIFLGGSCEIQMQEENGDFFEYTSGKDLETGLQCAYEKFHNGD